MSQSSRSHVKARARWREQVARFIVRVCEDTKTGRWIEHLDALDEQGFRPPPRLEIVHFDVAAVRTAAERELARAEADLVELEVFSDWTRERGRGPESMTPGAFVRDRSCRWCEGAGADGYEDPRSACEGSGSTTEGGWPGNLAREYARKRCPNECAVHPGGGGRYYGPEPQRRCTICDHRGWAPNGDRRADIVTAPARARVARRVLGMLDARPGTMWAHAKRQPSECGACGGHGLSPVGEVATVEGISPSRSRDVRVEGLDDLQQCRICRGTGHNLSGTLPPLVASPAVRRRRADQGLDDFDIRTGETWLDDPEVAGSMSTGWGVFSREDDGLRVSVATPLPAVCTATASATGRLARVSSALATSSAHATGATDSAASTNTTCHAGAGANSATRSADGSGARGFGTASGRSRWTRGRTRWARSRPTGRRAAPSTCVP